MMWEGFRHYKARYRVKICTQAIDIHACAGSIPTKVEYQNYTSNCYSTLPWASCVGMLPTHVVICSV